MGNSDLSRGVQSPAAWRSLEIVATPERGATSRPWSRLESLVEPDQVSQPPAPSRIYARSGHALGEACLLSRPRTIRSC